MLAAALLSALTGLCQSTWTEGWQRAAARTYTLPQHRHVFISGDMGQWNLNDTASHFGVSSNRAYIISAAGRKALKMVTVEDPEGGANNMWVALIHSPNISITPGTLLSIYVACALNNPEWGGWRPFPTLTPPPGDNVHLTLWDSQGNMLVYLFQRPPDYEEHTTQLDVQFSNGSVGQVGYHEVFIDTWNAPGGTYQRNLYEDFQNVPGFRGGSIASIVFEITSVGDVTMDNLSIGTSIPNEPTPDLSYLLTVQANGEGTVAPNLSGQVLDPRRTYTLTARPRTGWVFSSWTGSIATNTPVLTFRPQTNMVLQANFAPSPFAATAGTYTGLFYPASGAFPESSGAVTITTTVNGTFSGNLVLSGARYPISGQFNANGQAVATVTHGQVNLLTLSLSVDLSSGTDRITGTVSGGSWTAQLTTDRDVFDGKKRTPAQAGQYTLKIPGNLNSPTLPGGDSFVTATVDKSGGIRLSGSLADGTKITHSSAMSKNGQWPLYIPLYSRQGYIMSWISFVSGSSVQDLKGTLLWTKPSMTKETFYSGPFAISRSLTGCRFNASAEGGLLGFSEGNLVLAGGNLAQSITNRIRLEASNRVTNLGTNKLSLTFMPATGLFKGSLAQAPRSKPLSFAGVALQKRHLGCGYFLGKDQSGQVLLQP